MKENNVWATLYQANILQPLPVLLKMIFAKCMTYTHQSDLFGFVFLA